MSEMTLQDVFNITIKGLSAQNWERAVPADNGESPFGCMYKNKSGHKCAVGHHIPDEKYHPDMEGTLENLLCSFPNLFKGYPEGYKLLFRDMQSIHDKSSSAFVPFAPMKERFQEYAKRHGFVFEV